MEQVVGSFGGPGGPGSDNLHFQDTRERLLVAQKSQRRALRFKEKV